MEMKNNMKIITFSLLIVLALSVSASSQVWTEFATIDVRGMEVKLYGDSTSLRIDEENENERRLWVKFELSGNMKSPYNDKEYSIRKEEYFFKCAENEYTVAHTILMDDDGNTVFDSGYHHPFNPGYEKNWYQVTPGLGPEIIYDKVCNLEGKEDPDTTGKSESDPGKDNETDEGYVSSGSITGGEITDGLDVKNVRWAIRKGFERIVFDVYKWGGYEKPEGTEPAEVPGYFEVSGKRNENGLLVRIGGYRSFSAQFPELKDSDLIEEISINRNEKLADDSGFIIEIDLKKPVIYKAFELHDPARIVVDLKEASS